MDFDFDDTPKRKQGRKKHHLNVVNMELEQVSLVILNFDNKHVFIC